MSNNYNSSFSKPDLTDEFPEQVSVDSYVEGQYSDNNLNQSWVGKTSPDGVAETPTVTPVAPITVSVATDTSGAPRVGRRSVDKRVHKGNIDILRRGDGSMSENSERASQSRVGASVTCCTISSTEPRMNQKVITFQIESGKFLFAS